MRFVHLVRALLASAFVVSAASAFAQLTVRLDPELDDPGASNMPARFGTAKSNKGSGAATQFALAYSITKAGKGDFIYEPFAAIVVNDNPSTKTDMKSAVVGVKSVLRDLTLGTAWLLDASVARSRDRSAATSSLEAEASAEPVPKWLKHGLGYTPGKWGLFIRPKGKLYHLSTLETDDPAKAPKGRATGLQLEVAFDLYPAFSDRMKLSVSGAYAKDVSASGDRNKDEYKKVKAQLEYCFYNAADPPKGGPLFSVVAERAIGRSALSTSVDKKATSGIYLGIKF